MEKQNGFIRACLYCKNQSADSLPDVCIGCRSSGEYLGFKPILTLKEIEELKTLKKIDEPESVDKGCELTNEQPKNVNVLGTEYAIRIDSASVNPKLVDANGYIERYTKEIVLEPLAEGTHFDTANDMKSLNDLSLRHELVHAFFTESGLREYCEDEKLVEWIAYQVPKMITAFRETGCIKE